MDQQSFDDDIAELEPVHADDGGQPQAQWTQRLVLFLRVMAFVALCKGLYHWSRVCGVAIAPGESFETNSIAWQAATIFFAVIDLIAAVGLWLAAAWGAVIWLISIASLITVDVFFPQVFQAGLAIDLGAALLLAIYLWLAVKSAQEHPS
jgi:hypothetical protein